MKHFIITTLFALSLFAGASIPTVNADVQPGGKDTSLQPGGRDVSPSVQGDQKLINPLGEEATLESFLVQIINLFIRIGTLVIITMIIYIGFLFVAAQGAPEKISNARNMLLWTLIGGLILLGAQAIATGIQATVTEISNTAPQTIQ